METAWRRHAFLEWWVARVDGDRLATDDRGSCKGPPPDCRRIVIRLRYGVKGGCGRRAASTGEIPLVKVHAKPPLTPSLQRMERQQSVRWGRGAAPGPRPGGTWPVHYGRAPEMPPNRRQQPTAATGSNL
jgi:hypothetical protein